MRGFHPSRPLLDPQLVFARHVLDMSSENESGGHVERKRVWGPSEAWKGAASSYHILKWGHFERLLTVVKTIYQYS